MANVIDIIMLMVLAKAPGQAMTCPPNTSLDSGPPVTTMMLMNHLHQLIDDQHSSHFDLRN